MEASSQRALLASNIEIVSTETMPFDDQSYSAVVSRNVTAARARARMSQSMVAARMKALGYSWYQQTIGAIERGERRVEIAELLGLALVLGTSIGSLLDPSDDDPFIELPSGKRVLTGTVQRSVRHFNDGMVWWDASEPRFESSIPEDREWPAGDMRSLEEWDTPENWRKRTARIGPKPLIAESVPPPPEISATQVVAAIVTHGERVLIARRNDGTPPWTFIAGEQEPGEQLDDTIIREVKEETGLDIRPGEVIGTRMHPQTGRRMVYIAARPVGKVSVFVGDEAELAEVKWASLAEAEELLPGMYRPVWEYLVREIGEDQQ